jgi:hypothetical protein
MNPGMPKEWIDLPMRLVEELRKNGKDFHHIDKE